MRDMTIEEMQKMVCRYFDVDIDKIREKRLGLPYYNARFFIWYYMHYTFDMSYHSIAKDFNVHVDSVFKAMNKMRFGIANDNYYKVKYNDLEKERVRLEKQSELSRNI